MSKSDLRIMRIPVPVRLIREMDEVIINGIGGYATRSEFIVDAIQERVLELMIDAVEEAGAPPGLKISEVVEPQESVEKAASLVMTVLKAPAYGYAVSTELDLSRPEGVPLFGLHNRDFPSFWALAQLAVATADGPIPIESFYTKATQEAWVFGQLLMQLEKDTDRKLTARFPTNTEKRKSAEAGFRNFAIGSYQETDGMLYKTTGPLFEWRAVGLIHGEGPMPLIGLTCVGQDLLRSISGISVEEPHSTNAANSFMNHLQKYAPADYAVFIEITRVIGSAGATRNGVLEHIAETWTDWTVNEVSTNSAGYIARAREWGLVEYKQTKSRYQLTSAGIELMNGANK